VQTATPRRNQVPPSAMSRLLATCRQPGILADPVPGGRKTPEGASSSRSRKEVIQPQVPLRLPCYDFTPVADLTVVGCLLAVGAPASGQTNSHGVTGGVYKARERIHRGMLIRDY
jgi:hypothetical protein